MDTTVAVATVTPVMGTADMAMLVVVHTVAMALTVVTLATVRDTTPVIITSPDTRSNPTRSHRFGS